MGNERAYRVVVQVPVDQIFLENWSAEQTRDYIVLKADEYARSQGIVVEHCRREFGQQVENFMNRNVEMFVTYVPLQVADKPDIIAQ